MITHVQSLFVALALFLGGITSSALAAEIQMNVKGMTCGGCESLIEKKVSTLPNVKSVKADHKSGLVTIITNSDEPTPSDKELKEAVTAAGYQPLKVEYK